MSSSKATRADRSAYSQLHRKWQQVVDAFVRCGIQSDAYTEVYGPTKRPDVSASKLFAKPIVQRAVEERTQQAIARAGVRNLRVLEELAAIAFFDPADIFENGDLRPIGEMPEKARRALASIEVEDLYEGRGESREYIGTLRKVKHWPKIDALTKLGQYLKLFTEKHEISGPNGGPIETKEVSDLDKARRVAFLLAQGLREAQAASSPESGNPAGSPPAHSTKQETS